MEELFDFPIMKSGVDELVADIIKSNYDNRRLIINDEINNNLLESICLYILKYNQEDKDVPEDKRKPIWIILNSVGGVVNFGMGLIDCIKHSITPVYCLIIGICSNGVLYRDEKVQAFLRKWANRLSFSVTIDGNKELHDSCRVFPDGGPSYDIAVDAASDWMKRGNHMGSKITIAPGNISFLYDAIKHMVDLGYDEINANCVYEKGWTPVHATVLYDQMKRISDYFLEQNFDFERDFFCSLYNEDFFQPKDPDDLQSWCGGVGNSMIACDPQGRIFPCIRYMESSLNGEQEPYSIGDVDNGIGCTECYKCRINCMAKIDRRTQSTDECFYCPIAAGCSNCSGYDYQVNGTPDSKATYICVMHKARALGNLYFWNKYYRKNNMSKRMKNYVPDEWALEIISESELNMLKELERED